MGMVSCVLALVPIAGFIAATSHYNAHPGAGEAPLALKLFARTTTGIIPVLGLMSGIIGVLISTRRALSVMGILFNTFWIIFMQLMLSGLL